MRVSIISILLAGGVLGLGACATVDSTSLTLAERAKQCADDAWLGRTGSQTGDVRQDYRCIRHEPNLNSGPGHRSDLDIAITNSLRGG
jgi:hypothetical protein